MDNQLDIQTGDLNEFKTQVKQWLSIDEEIQKATNKIKELKQLKKKVLEPQITTFMINYNISDLNTDQGKIRCNERMRKKPLNKTNIRSNLNFSTSRDKVKKRLYQTL